jgi:hypothetical protein
MLDLNGRQFREHGMALLLCEVLAIETEGVRVRILNSDLELLVGCKRDEVLGEVADPELTVYEPEEPTTTTEPRSHGEPEKP